MSDLNAVAELKIAIGDYWDIAQAEAMDQRDHDDESGSAQAKWFEIERLIDRQAKQRAALLEALRDADKFITNGVELGFIRMPDPDTADRAHDTPGVIRAAIALAQGDAA